MRAPQVATKARRYGRPLQFGCAPTPPLEHPPALESARRHGWPATVQVPRHGFQYAAFDRSWRLTFSHESISHTPHGQEVLRVGRIALEALAQAQNEIVHGAGGGKHVVAPHLFQQILTRDDLTRVLCQYLEDHGFFFSELLRDTVPGAGAECAEINLVPSEMQHGAGRRC